MRGFIAAAKMMNADLKWDNDRLTPNNTPGIGIDWNWDAVEYYRRLG